MAVTEIGDPRLKALFGADDPREAGVRPVVALPRRGIPPLAVAAIVLLIAIALFFALEARRTGRAEPRVSGRALTAPATAWESPPPLYVPPVAPTVAPVVLVETKPQPAPRVVAPVTVPVLSGPRNVPQISYTPSPLPMMPPAPMPANATRNSSGPALVIDGGGAGPAGSAAPREGLSGSTAGVKSGLRVRASAFANRSATIPQGHLIPAVLETAFDSTKPGFARAIVSRDVRSFDGTNVLIPRGSRLIGDYRADVGQTQKRAMITWSRLIRPDGMTIALDSPAVDTLGRGGVAASVNTHFVRRLGDALLQSTMDIGRTLAGRAVTGPVVVLPGGNGAAASLSAQGGSNYVPTLTVPAGRSISVFVARDLDFSSVGADR
jgi:type IV secretion system protein VirB10